MGYSLGIDLGATTCVVALRRGAVRRGLPDRRGRRGHAGRRRCRGPTARCSSARRPTPAASTSPPLVARYVVSRLGDGQPIDIDGHQLDPLALTRAVLREAIDRAAPLPGVAPDHVVVTYPLLPGVGPEELIADAAGRGVRAVRHPRAGARRRGGPAGRRARASATTPWWRSSTSAARASTSRSCGARPTAFDLVGDPATLSDLGGVDLDGAVLSLVEGAIGDVSSAVVPGDSAGMLALRRLRASCRAAKERLSVDDTAVVEVAMPTARGRVEITRDAFERTSRPHSSRRSTSCMATIDDAGLIPADLRAVVVTGGSARIPRVTELLQQRTGLPVLAEARPEATVALGAALFADVSDDLAGPAAGAPGPLSGSTGTGSGLGAAALGLGAAGAAAAGLAGAAAAGAAEGDDAGLAGFPGLAPLPLTGMEAIPPIGPTTGGGPLPWEDGHPATRVPPIAPPEDPAPALWPDQPTGESSLWPDPWPPADTAAPADPLASAARRGRHRRPMGVRPDPRPPPPTPGRRPHPRPPPPTHGRQACPRSHPPTPGRQPRPRPLPPTRGPQRPPTPGPHPTPTTSPPPTPGGAPTTPGRPGPSPRPETGAGRPIRGRRARSPPCRTARATRRTMAPMHGRRGPSRGPANRRPPSPATTPGPTAAPGSAPRRGAGTTGARPHDGVLRSRRGRRAARRPLAGRRVGADQRRRGPSPDDQRHRPVRPARHAHVAAA